MYRTDSRPCPACPDGVLEDQGRFQRCAGCQGIWIDEETLAAKFAQTGGEMPPLLAVASAVGDRACVVCRDPMSPRLLGPVTVERCAAHGVWLDAGELARALNAVVDEAPLAPPRRWTAGDVLDVLRGLFEVDRPRRGIVS